MQIERVRSKFKELFGEMNVTTFFSPGRINLIGEHTDYNGGHVFPASITIGTYGVASKREDSLVCVYSLNFEEKGVIEFNLEDLAYRKEDGWANYVKGYILKAKEKGYEISTGFNLVLHGNIPNGSGLSSSASLELLVGVVIKELYALDISTLELVEIGKKTENEYIGVNSGIMDQFAIAFGQKDKAIYLDTNTLEYEMAPAEFGDYVVVIMNTNKRRELAESKYNERRSECEEALRRLQTSLPIQSLGELSAEEFEKNRKLINDDILEKRAKHAVYENERTMLAVSALQKGDLVAFGELLNASHQSLKDDYEVTGVELDTLAETAQKVEGVLGSRMTGAGFGGCAIALVHKDSVEKLENTVDSTYTSLIGYPASFYTAEIGNGAGVLE
ncbi:galactokinase [Pilibacter termitis]|uniref:Galactokinase n=1 Tax=Pilibacter termitis TaxID=263852 RepID=A0A1T4PMX5_9ENTE|nr:galactokinase [Pilibacter termitis]SJZ92606.1 galactokinase [Pilibacter termitis]